MQALAQFPRHPLARARPSQRKAVKASSLEPLVKHSYGGPEPTGLGAGILRHANSLLEREVGRGEAGQSSMALEKERKHRQKTAMYRLLKDSKAPIDHLDEEEREFVTRTRMQMEMEVHQGVENVRQHIRVMETWVYELSDTDYIEYSDGIASLIERLAGICKLHSRPPSVGEAPFSWKFGNVSFSWAPLYWEGLLQLGRLSNLQLSNTAYIEYMDDVTSLIVHLAGTCKLHGTSTLTLFDALGELNDQFPELRGLPMHMGGHTTPHGSQKRLSKSLSKTWDSSGVPPASPQALKRVPSSARGQREAPLAFVPPALAEVALERHDLCLQLLASFQIDGGDAAEHVLQVLRDQVEYLASYVEASGSPGSFQWRYPPLQYVSVRVPGLSGSQRRPLVPPGLVGQGASRQGPHGGAGEFDDSGGEDNESGWDTTGSRRGIFD
eukprot:gene20122-26852_t